MVRTVTDNSPRKLPYADSLDDLRRQLIRASLMHQRSTDQKFATATDLAKMPEQDKVSLVGSMMAANYAYTLAGVLRMVETKAGTAVADEVGAWVDDCLVNGDFSEMNADLLALVEGEMGPRD